LPSATGQAAGDGEALDLHPSLPRGQLVLAHQGVVVQGLEAHGEDGVEVDAHLLGRGGPHRFEGFLGTGPGGAERLGSPTVTYGRRHRPRGANPKDGAQSDRQQQTAHLTLPGGEEAVHPDLLF
jgi:hypothetical protein